MLKQAHNNKTPKMTKYKVERESGESRIGKGKAEMKGQSYRTGYLQNSIKRNAGLA
jgi:hypothetical protein